MAITKVTRNLLSTGIDDQSNATAITIDSSERVLIGKNSSTDSAALEIDANNVGSSTYSARIENSNTATNIFNVLRFAQGESGTATGIIGTGGSLAGNTAFRNTFAMITQNATGLVLGTNDTERMRITATGALEFQNQDFSNIGTIYASQYLANGDADTGIVMQGSNVMSLHTGNSERMRIHSSGCVGIGSSVDRSLGTNIGTLVVNGSAGGGLWLSTGDSSSTTSKIYSTTDGSVGELIINQGSGVGGGNIKFTHNESATPTMIIQSNGVLLIGTTSQSGISNTSTNHGISIAGGGQYVVNSDNDTNFIINRSNGTGNHIQFRYNGGNTGSISTNGSTISYNTSSDYRLKENVDYEFNALDRVAQLKPARFNFIADETNTLVDGFLAHEVQDIVPEAITGEKDTVDSEGNPEYQGIDQSKLVPLLTKAIQEQQTIIDNLITRIETLENA